MRLSALLLITIPGLAFASPFDNYEGVPEAPQKKKSAPKSKSARQVPQSMTGCVDEQDGNYILLDDQRLKKVADLQAANTDNEGFFAKHLGHKVTVKGSKSSAPEAKFKVTSIEDLAEVCAPAQSPNQQ